MAQTLIGVDPTRVNTDLVKAGGFKPGDRHVDDFGKEYVFVQASAAVGQYDAVWVKSDHEVIPITNEIAETSGGVAIAQAALAVDAYGWVQTRGACIVSAKGSCAANVPLFTSATAGAVDDATTSLSQVAILGLVLQSAEAASQAAAYIENATIFKTGIAVSNE